MNFEQAIIFVFLKNQELILKSDITPSDFNDLFLAECLHVMRVLVLSGIEIDTMIVADKINNPNALQILVEILRDGIGVKSNLKLYISQVKDFKIKQKLHEALTDALNEIKQGSVKDIVSELSSKLSTLQNKDIDHAYTSKEMMCKTIEHIDEVFSSDDEFIGVTTGIKKLDKELGGFHKSDLIVIGARPSMGKTAIAVNCSINAAKKGFKVGFISTEMSVVQLGQRALSIASKIPALTMRDGNFQEDDWAKLTAGSSLVAQLPFYVYDKPVCRVSDITLQAKAWKESEGLDIIFIDYITRLKPEGTSENKAIAVGNIATDLKTLARTLDIPVVVLAQVSRKVEERKDRRPNMGDLRDSGVIEQEADQILMLYRDIIYNGDADPFSAEINIEKNRHGAICGLDVEFNPHYMQWQDKTEY